MNISARSQRLITLVLLIGGGAAVTAYICSRMVKAGLDEDRTDTSPGISLHSILRRYAQDGIEEKTMMMQRNHRFCRTVLAVTVAVVGLLVVGTTPVAHADSQPKILPLDSSPYGNTYGEWSARWWQWVMSIPAATNPNLDSTGANCAVGQVGPVWFLAGSFGGSFTRSCTVPAGKALLLTPLTQLDGSGAFDCEPTAPGLCNLNALRALAADFADNPRMLEVVVDGHPVRNVGDYRVQSPVFTITYPDGAVFDLPRGTSTPNLSDGYWLLLAPPSAGAHTIILNGVNNSGFGVALTYHLTIAQ